MSAASARLRRGLAGLAVLAGLGAAAPAASGGPVVVELFTSQGCHSCPPADRVLGELADREDVLALGFHVTYWDDLGWPDPFATEAGTERQYAYARALRRHNVYTPQMVIDGRHDVVGSREGRVRDVIEEAGEERDGRLDVRLEWRGPGRLAFALPPGRGEGRLLLVRYARRLEQSIARGENAGKHLAYHNVVREMREVGEWRGEALEGEVEVDAPEADGPGGVALLVQGRRDMRMLGAAKLSLPPG